MRRPTSRDTSRFLLGWSIGAVATFMGHGLGVMLGWLEPAWALSLFTLANAAGGSLGWLYLNETPQERRLQEWYQSQVSQSSLPCPSPSGQTGSKSSSASEPGPAPKPWPSPDVSQERMQKDD